MRQISGEVHAAAQASTCCDVTGEESPNGAPRKMHAFCGVPGLEGEIKITPEMYSLFKARLNTTKPPSEDKGADKAIREIAPFRIWLS